MTTASPQRPGSWMTTRSGMRFYPLDPRPGDFCIEDIAHALALENRYNGHTPEPYSVAQHSVLVASRVAGLTGGDRRAELWGLLHDASEAYIKDLPRPVKRLMPEYQAVEKRVMAAICDRFGLPHAMPASTHQADNELLVTEALAFYGPDVLAAWGLPYQPLRMAVAPLTWDVAERLFLARFKRLTEA